MVYLSHYCHYCHHLSDRHLVNIHHLMNHRFCHLDQRVVL